MAFGDGPDDTLLREAWGRFCDQLREAGEHMFKDSFPASPEERAEAFRYLTHAIPIGLAFHVENATPMHPWLMHYFDPTRKHAGDNSDALYYGASIDGSQTYRISGKRGSAHWFVITVLRPGGPPDWQAPYRYPLDAEPLDIRSLAVAADGSFEVWLSPDPHAGNWIKTTPETRAVRIRQFFGDWDLEEPATIHIERVGGEDVGPPPLLTPRELVERLGEVGEFVLGTAQLWPDGLLQNFLPDHPPNDFFVSMPDPEAIRKVGVDANPGGMTAFCTWELAPDEALLVEFTPQQAYFWGFQNEAPWLQTFDYRWRLTSMNCKQAVLEDDASCRLVVSTGDPGTPNWLDTAGFSKGLVTYRGTLCDSPAPTFRAEVVKLEDLSGRLPAGARRVTAEERKEQLRRRAVGVRNRFRM